MRKFRVSMHTKVSLSIDIEMSDEQLADIAVTYGKAVSELTLNDISEYADTAAHEHIPPLCFSCAGVGHGFSRDESPEWETDDDDEYGIIELTD